MRASVVGTKAVVLAGLLLFTFANVAACTLDARGLGDGALAGPGSSLDAAAPDAMTIDAAHDVAASASEGDDARADASSWLGDAASGSDGGDPCDRDGDGHRDAQGLCAGDDCCDTDARVHPGAKGFFETASACGSFDYDCDGQQTTESGTVHCQLGFFACSGDGFSTSAGCGVNATFTVCSWAGLACSTKDEARVQRCH